MKQFIIFLALVLGLSAWPHPCAAHPTIILGVVVPGKNQVPVEKIDHTLWNTLLLKYVDTKGFVNYNGWKKSTEDNQNLDDYLAILCTAKFDANSSKQAQLAFWINAYNAVTIKGILKEYPTASIRNHTAKFYGYNIWKDLQLPVAGRTYSLEIIEHQVLRKMGDPRMHFGIVCASVGCPRLLNEAYTMKGVEEQLNRNARAFFADPSKCVIDERTGNVRVSPILKWFAEDFGPDSAAQLKFITSFVEKSPTSIAPNSRPRISYLDYDWGLNDQANQPAAGR